jgi:hypothetical protein
MRPRLEQEDAPATVGELSGDDPAARPRAHDDHVEPLGHLRSDAGKAGASAPVGSVEPTP